MDWTAVLDALDAGRAEAFATGELSRLDRVYAPASAGLAADRALLRSLADRRQTADGVRHELRSVELVAGGSGDARLRVVDVLRGYTVRDADGAVVARSPGRGPQEVLVDLLETPAGWRLAEVRAGAPGSPS